MATSRRGGRRDEREEGDHEPYAMMMSLVPAGRGFKDLLPSVGSSRELEARFGREEQCRDHLFRCRWPDGFECFHCGGRWFRWLDNRRLKCGACRRKTALTAGTILERTRKPLVLWFRAAFILSQYGASARRLQEMLGLTYKVAWMWAHKLRRLMALDTIVEEPVRPFAPPRWMTTVETIELARLKWSFFHGGYEWAASRPGGLGECCQRLDGQDWRAKKGHALGFSREELFRTCSGSMSDKHVSAYLKQVEFRMNRRGVPESRSAAELMGRFARERPWPYSEIRGERRAREPISLQHVTRGGASPRGGAVRCCAGPRRSGPSSP
ncbi:MAG: transposase [Planctomycetota bacterium]